MSELRNLQHAFQRALLLNDRAAVISHVADADPAGLTSRLNIYEHAYRSRLQTALECNFPMLARWLGAEAFAQIAQSYIVAHPSQHFSIRRFGEALAPVLEQAFGDRPWIAEFARWEWALGACFDAPDGSPLEPQTLAQFSMHQWPALQFELHPATELFTAQTNAPQIYKALADECVPADPAVTSPCHFVIWRRDLAPRYRVLDVIEYDALQALRTGATFAALCTIIDGHRTQDAAARAAALLREWLDAHLLCNVRVSS